MCDVLILQRTNLCHAFCECGYVGRFSIVPVTCPTCGGDWRAPRVECLNALHGDGISAEKTAVPHPA